MIYNFRLLYYIVHLTLPVMRILGDAWFLFVLNRLICMFKLLLLKNLLIMACLVIILLIFQKNKLCDVFALFSYYFFPAYLANSSWYDRNILNLEI